MELFHLLTAAALLVCHCNAGVLWSLAHFPSSNILSDFKAEKSFGEENMKLVSDPAGGHNQVLRVFYPKGTYRPAHHPQGGAQFYSRPIGQKTSLTLTFDIYFDKNFDFVKGGKLPGLFGGHNSCSGGASAETCFSTRFMFRREGEGEVYLYAPREQDSNFCSSSHVICNFEKGHSLGRGSWHFQKGHWHTMSQHITLNTHGHHNGHVTVWVDGHQVFKMSKMNFRNSDSVKIEGIFFSTFFGGADSSWATPHDTYTYYRNFYLTDDEHPHIVG